MATMSLPPDGRYWIPWFAAMMYPLSNCILSRMIPNISPMAVAIGIGGLSVASAVAMALLQPQQSSTHLPQSWHEWGMFSLVITCQVVPNLLLYTFFVRRPGEAPPPPIGDPRYSSTVLTLMPIFSTILLFFIWKQEISVQKLAWMLVAVFAAIMCVRTK
jgi:drug/metabolite transporter (DMT)-like permease